LRISKPPNFRHMDDREYQQMVERAVVEREEAVRREMVEQGKGFLGVKAIVKQSPGAAPRSLEERRNAKPRVASHDKWRRVQALQQDKAWQEHYREALLQFQSGKANVVFPAGTYWLVRYAGARCAAYEHD
jgi:putative transposase